MRNPTAHRAHAKRKELRLLAADIATLIFEELRSLFERDFWS